MHANNFVILVILLLLLLIFHFSAAVSAMQLWDDDVIASQTLSCKDADGLVTVTMEWLRRPGEMNLIIEYFGYLIQEGTVNFYLEVNGIRREFCTLIQKLPSRAHRIRFRSFHPSFSENGITKLKPLPEGDVVDYLLFRNAAYYPQFGRTHVELKFFAHGRWDGDSNNGNSNYVFEFESPIKEKALDHF